MTFDGILKLLRVTPPVLALLPILVAALTTVLAAFAFLTLPASPDPLSDLDVVTCYYCITIIIIVIVYIIIVIVIVKPWPQTLSPKPL